VFLVFAVALMGLFSKLYTGTASHWVSNSLGGVFYEVFWCLVVFLLANRVRPWKIAVAVFLVTCALEALQLWHPPFLVPLRNHFIGHALLGSVFIWTDFVYYVIGCVVGWMWMQSLQRIERAG
jgi:Na+-translocating ferredoxin:NAD+ oxidoreductase RnfD subunit